MLLYQTAGGRTYCPGAFVAKAKTERMVKVPYEVGSLQSLIVENYALVGPYILYDNCELFVLSSTISISQGEL